MTEQETTHEVRICRECGWIQPALIDVSDDLMATQCGLDINDICDNWKCAHEQTGWDTKTMTTEEYVAAYRKQFEQENGGNKCPD